MDKELKAATKLLGRNLVCHLARTLARARALHPEFAASASDASGVIMDAVCELDAAVERYGRDRQEEMALDVVVTGIRFLRGEHVPGIGRDMPYWGGAQLTGAWIDESSLLSEPEKLDFEPGRLSVAVHEGPADQRLLLDPGFFPEEFKP